MAEESSSTIVVVPPSRPTVLNGTDPSQNLIVFNVNAHAPLELTASNYSTWHLQFMSLLFGYDLLGIVNGLRPCPPTMITLPDAASPSPNPDHILQLRQDQLLLNAIVGSISATLVQFISTSTTSHVAWTTLEKIYASPSCRRIMTHHQNLACPQQGNQTITDYMQDIKHNSFPYGCLC